MLIKLQTVNPKPDSNSDSDNKIIYNHHVNDGHMIEKPATPTQTTSMEARFVSAFVGLLLAAAVRGTALVCPEESVSKTNYILHGILE